MLDGSHRMKTDGNNVTLSTSLPLADWELEYPLSVGELGIIIVDSPGKIDDLARKLAEVVKARTNRISQHALEGGKILAETGMNPWTLKQLCRGE